VSVSSILPSAAEIRAAASRIGSELLRTELRHSSTLSAFLGGDVYLKLECQQRTESFKFRGALNVLMQFTPAERAAGVVVSSAGNHGLGVAAAAKKLGIAATVFVPATSPTVKKEKIASYGARVDDTAAHYDDAERLARAHSLHAGAVFVSPCTGRELLAGQGTVGVEILESLPDVATIVVCVGGGGLAGGIAGYLREASPSVRIVGAQSELTNAMALALQSGKATKIPDRPTLADGLAGLVDDEMLAQGRAALDEIDTVTESSIADAIAFLWMEEGVRVEGAGAVGVAVLMADRSGKWEFPIAVTVSGGNIDESRFEGIVEGASGSASASGEL
jgi:threonine dehydratase